MEKRSHSAICFSIKFNMKRSIFLEIGVCDTVSLWLNCFNSYFKLQRHCLLLGDCVADWPELRACNSSFAQTTTGIGHFRAALAIWVTFIHVIFIKHICLHSLDISVCQLARAATGTSTLNRDLYFL